MTVRYLAADKTLVTFPGAVNVQPVGTLELLVESAASRVVIGVTQLVDIV